MSITDENTTHKNLPLPHATNDLSADVERLRQTIQSLDGYINGLETEIAAKAAGTHNHEIDQITGLQAIITDLQNQSAPDVLSDLSDVDAAGIPNGWALFRQAGKWIGKKLGIGDIDQLTEALNSKVSVTGSTISGLDADLVDGMHASELTPYQSGSDFADGTLVTTDLTGGSFLLEITGKLYSGNPYPCRLIVEGYRYTPNFINFKVLDLGGAFIGPFKAFEDDTTGKLKFWWPRQGYWSSFSVKAWAANSSSEKPRNAVTSITNSVAPTDTIQADAVIHKNRHAGNDGSGSGLDADTVDGYQLDKLLRRTPWIAHPGHDADTMTSGEVGFTYANNAPHVGPIVRMGINGYDIELNGSYGHGAGYLAFRMRNGDNATWHDWREFWHNGNLDPVRRTSSGLLEAVYGTHNAGLGNLAGVTLDTSIAVRGRHFFHGNNNGAFTVAAPTNDSVGNSYTAVFLVYNAGGAGAISFSGFNKVESDELTTTGGHWFMIFITKIGGLKFAQVKRIVG